VRCDRRAVSIANREAIAAKIEDRKRRAARVCPRTAPSARSAMGCTRARLCSPERRRPHHIRHTRVGRPATATNWLLDALAASGSSRRSRSRPPARDVNRAWRARRRPRCCSVTQRAICHQRSTRRQRPLSDTLGHALGGPWRRRRRAASSATARRLKGSRRRGYRSAPKGAVRSRLQAGRRSRRLASSRATARYRCGCRENQSRSWFVNLVAGITDARDRPNRDITGTYRSNRAILGHLVPPSNGTVTIRFVYPTATDQRGSQRSNSLRPPKCRREISKVIGGRRSRSGTYVLIRRRCAIAYQVGGE
jgi:hypothetical protein